MPVRLEHIYSPSSQDWIDLQKIHEETAQDGLTLDIDALKQWLQTDNHWILAGRFNDRIVGCCLATLETENQITLSNAGVRRITQRRGVMHQLLHHICQWANQEGKCLQILTPPAELHSALGRRQFTAIGPDFLYNKLNKS